MSAAELRKAAETLRKRAGACEPTDGDETSASWADEYNAKAHEREHGYYSADIAYIATVSPAVGAALADWLDDAAIWESTPNAVNYDMRAHDIARLINSGAS